MAIRIRWQDDPGQSLAYSIERLADGFNYDFGDSTFKNTTPTTLTAAMAEDPLRPGIYAATLASTPQATFPDGDYAVYLNDSITGQPAGVLGAVMHDGDDATVVSGGSADDPYLKSFAYGEVTVLPDGSVVFSDPADPATKRLKWTPKDLPGGRTVTKDPT